MFADYHCCIVHFSKKASTKNREAGYTLVALLAAMTVLAISLTAAAPILKQQAQRERELEAIRRGEEVAEAIRIFYEKSQKPPASMDELIEGVNVPGRTKKLQVLRASAARDPLSEDGEWRLIRQSASNSALCDFYAALTKYNDGVPLQQNQVDERFGFRVQQCGVGSAFGGGGSGGLEGSGPFVGVASKSDKRSVVAYYGLENHNEWVFTPALPKQN